MSTGDSRPDGSELWAYAPDEAAQAVGVARDDSERTTVSTADEGELARLTERLTALDAHLSKADERARHRESIIDRLHAENQELRVGERRGILDPVITDLVRLHEQLEREGNGLAERDEPTVGRLLLSLADDVVLALERVGVEPFHAEVGETFRSERHRALSAIETTDAERGNTIARVVTHGFRDTESGRMRRKVQAHFYRYVSPGSDATTFE